MIVVDKKTVEIEVLIDVRCDRCGASCKGFMEQNVDSWQNGFERASINAVWGYGSKWDGDCWSYEVCQDCAEELLEWISSKKSL